MSHGRQYQRYQRNSKQKTRKHKDDKEWIKYQEQSHSGINKKLAKKENFGEIVKNQTGTLSSWWGALEDYKTPHSWEIFMFESFCFVLLGRLGF